MVIFTIIGSIIGAGFASGQEIYLFFYKYGIKGIYGLILCSFFISLIIYKSLKIIYENNVMNYLEFLKIIFKSDIHNKYLNLSFINNVIINLFLYSLTKRSRDKEGQGQGDFTFSLPD